MREMQDSGVEWIGKIPSTWKINTAFQVFTQVKNKNVDLLEKNLLSLSYGRIKRKNIEATDGLLPESFDAYNIVEKGDIVLRLTDLQNDQRSLRVGLVTERGIVTSAYLTIRNHSESLEKYLYYYLHAFDISKGFYGMGAGVRQGLNWDGIKRLEIISPPVHEQIKIVSFLDAECSRVDAVIEQILASIEECKKLKQSVIMQAITKGTRSERAMKDSGIDWIGSIPNNWNREKVKRIFQIIGSGTTPKSDDPDYYKGNIHWIQSGDINGGILCDSKTSVSDLAISKFSALKIYTAPFIVMAMYGGSIGNLSISKIDGCVNQACCVMQNGNQDIRYSYYALKVAKDFLVWKAVGGGQPNISQETIKQLWLPMPPYSEQVEIADFLDRRIEEADALIKKKEKLLVELDAFRKSLVFEYATGKKEVL